MTAKEAAIAELERLEAQLVQAEAGFTAGEMFPFTASTTQATFNAAAVAAITLLADIFGPGRDFPEAIKRMVAGATDGFYKPAPHACVLGVLAQVREAKHYVQRHGIPQHTWKKTDRYVSDKRLAELRDVPPGCPFDTTRLVRLCEELNEAWDDDCLMSVALLLRAIINHVPPVFGVEKFSEVADNLPLPDRSIREQIQRLATASRKVADAHAHIPIRSSEVLPTQPQVQFQAELDVLLGEVIRHLKKNP